MSSSLDDLEPYEIFQNELDEYLKEYEKSLYHAEPGNHLLIINTFIEYICFIRSASSFDELSAEEIHVDFLSFIQNKFGKEIRLQEIIVPVYCYLEFIYKKHGKLNKELLNGLKS